MGKCVMLVTKPDLIDPSGSLQLFAGHKSGSAILAMRNIFEADETDSVLLIDASNAFNALNRAAALHNIRELCLTLATYVINTYRQPKCTRNDTALGYTSNHLTMSGEDSRELNLLCSA